MRKLQNNALLHLSIIYLSITYFIWCTMRYKMRRTRVTCKVTKSTKLPGGQRSPELGLRSTDFCAPEKLIFPALEISTFCFYRNFSSWISDVQSNVLLLVITWKKTCSKCKLQFLAKNLPKSLVLNDLCLVWPILDR